MSTLRTTTISNVAGSSSVPVDTVINGSAKAWVNFNGTGTVAIRAAFNVSSITDNGTGDYTLNFASAMADSNYAPTFSNRSVTGGTSRAAFIHNTVAPTASALRFHTYDGTSALVDLDYVNAAVFR